MYCFIIIFNVGAGKITLMYISDGLYPYNFRRKKERTRPITKEMDGKVFSRHIRISFIVIFNFEKNFFSFYFNLACEQLRLPPGKRTTRRNESSFLVI